MINFCRRAGCRALKSIIKFGLPSVKSLKMLLCVVTRERLNRANK